MFQNFKLFLIVAAALTAVQFTNSAKLPSYIKKCSLSDPNLAQCVNERMTEVLPNFLKGNKELNIPPLNPLHLKEIVVEATKSLTLKLNDIELYGLETAKFSNVLADLQNRIAGVHITFDTLYLNATYDVDGQIMVLPIKGSGPFQINIKNGKFDIKFEFDLIDKNGDQYAIVKNPTLNFTTEYNHFHFDNLFNGNKELGDQINKLLEDNWREVSQDIQPAVSETLLTIYLTVINRIAEKLPFSELFAP